MKLTLEKIPTYMMPFFINGDVDGYTEDDINKIKNYINCLKKQISFYPEKVIDPDCIMTEVEEYIIQE